MTGATRTRKLAGAFAWTVALTVIVLALLTAAFRFVVPLVPAYRADVEGWASEVFGAPVDIDALDLRWRGIRPEIVLEGVRFISADAQRAVAASEVRIGISLQSLLVGGRVVPARIVLVEPDVMLVVDSAGGDRVGTQWQRAFAARDRRGVIEIESGRVVLVADEGRRRAELEQITGTIRSDGRRHRIELVARPGNGAAGTIAMDATGGGWPGEADWAMDVDINFTNVDLAAFQHIGRRARLRDGALNLELTLRIDHGVARSLITTAVLSDGADAVVRWTRRDGGWDASLVAHGVDGRRSGPVVLTHTDADPAYWHLASEQVYIEDLARFAAAVPWYLGARATAWLDRAPSGEVRRVDLVARRAGDGPPRYTLALEADALALTHDSASTIPGFTGVSLRIDADHERGRATVSVADGSVFFPRIFRERFGLRSAEVVADWTREADAWQVALPTISAANHHVAASGRGAALIADGKRPNLQLDLGFSEANLAAHHGYLPVNVMSDALVAWLDRAVLGGRAVEGVFRYDGAVGGGALAGGDASLYAAFDAEEISLAYADGWPQLDDADARVRFTGRGFDATVMSGRLGESPMSAEVAIAEFSRPVLTVDGRAGNDLEVMFDTFTATPVGRADWMVGASAAGTADLALAIALPLGRRGAADVEGRLNLAGASFRVTGFPDAITQLEGALQFSEDGVDASEMSGMLFGGPVDATVETLRSDDGVGEAVIVRLGGRVDTSTLERLAERPLPWVEGVAAWRAELLAPFVDGEPLLQIGSDLTGLAVDLPTPLGKSPADVRDVLVTIGFDGDARRVQVVDRDALRAIAEYEGGAGAWKLARGLVQIGPGETGAMPAEGIAISGSLASWRHGAADGAPVTSFAEGGARLTVVDLSIGELDLYGRELGAVHIDGRRAVDGWRWTLDGERAVGSVELPDAPDNANPIQAYFSRLAVPKRTGDVAPKPTLLDANKVPPIVFHAGRLQVGAMDFGEVNGALRSVENGVSLEGFSATRRDARVVAHGSWHTVDGYHRTVLRGAVDSTDVRATLAGLGYAASIEADAGHLELDVSWMDSAIADPLPTLAGTVGVRIERGNLLDVDAGAGRVFGLLSLYALPRRLALDFSDVFRRGLAFDIISGTFNIDAGQAHSEDLALLGPAVRVEVTGRTGLATRDYNQEAVVTASLASSLTIAGTIAGGPGVGAALLIASELFKGPLDDMARVRYRVTGPWDGPVIERVSEPR
ncbi:MAG: YhdP family protein [Gammaproteobacteria bacterium]